MILALWLLASAHACDLAMSVQILRETGAKEDYLCVAADPGGATAVTAALDGLQGTAEELDGPRSRYTRALTLWLLQQDVEWDPALVRRLSADDRRLLSDGVRAHRGRPSPAPTHDAIFKNLPWYKPDPNYTDGRLLPEDRAKIALADNPPPAPPPAPEVDEVAAAKEVAVQGPAAETPWCGCATGGAVGAWGIGAALLVVGRRRLGRPTAGGGQRWM